MRVKYVCGVFLLVFVCAFSEEQRVNENRTEEIEAEVKIILDNVVQQKAQCTSDADCHHLGTCDLKGDGSRSCNCKAGTSGESCERVDDCVDNPVKCGELDDVSCVFDAVLEKAVCKCDNESKTYVVDEERCMSPCTRYDQCGINGYCMHEVGDQKFCACELGATGDYCDVITACQNGDVDCGDGKDIECTLGTKGRAFCKCKDWKQSFDDEAKVCKDCSCGPWSHSCRFEKGTKMCQCYRDYQQNNGICEKCNCGPGATKCEFQDGKKVCTCKDGYISTAPDGNCARKCDAVNQCQNGGKCLSNVCSCLKGTSGDMCEEVEDCFKCGSAECRFNMTSRESYCYCSRENWAFDPDSKRCSDCDCGSFALKCAYVKGKKTCDCVSPYAHKRGRCEKCDCGGHGKCSFFGSIKRCDCDEGYDDDGGTCRECNCGEHGVCYFSNGKKVCNCKERYEDYQGTCKKCYCGQNSKCGFDIFGSEKCTCLPGFGMKDTFCTACDCYPGLSCEFRGMFEKTCICPQGYADYFKECKVCECELEGSNCSFNNLLLKQCHCPPGYEAKRGVLDDSICQDIDECARSHDCPHTTKCENTPGSYNCVCKEGYEIPYHVSYTEYDIKEKGCVDIDECRVWSACNDIWARCVNTPGSYRCDCTAGYAVRKGDKEKNNACFADSRPWRTATIVVGCLAGIVIVGLLFGICHKHAVFQ